MADEQHDGSEHATSTEPIFNLDLRGREDASPESQRFNFFLIDTGWNEPISKLVHKHFPKLLHLHCSQDLLFVLSPDQSIEVLRSAPYEIGHDPMILVYDLHAPEESKANRYRGFRLALGLIRHPEQAMARLQEFVRFIVMHRHSASLEKEIRKELHREGLQGMVKILRESTTEII